MKAKKKNRGEGFVLGDFLGLWGENEMGMGWVEGRKEGKMGWMDGWMDG